MEIASLRPEIGGGLLENGRFVRPAAVRQFCGTATLGPAHAGFVVSAYPKIRNKLELGWYRFQREMPASAVPTCFAEGNIARSDGGYTVEAAGPLVG